ncbi:MAG: hypothetical protein MI922_12580, partial [Bacteroidales bacterium]|nr:hypothetical protein [Bacteroidales bacterium]
MSFCFKNYICLIILLSLIIYSNTTKLAGNNIHDLKFNHLSLVDGLTESNIKCIIQDSLGFMWFGTRYGVNRYDGIRFKHYNADVEDPAMRLTANVAMCMNIDHKGQLWIGTGDGLNIYNPKEDHIQWYFPNKWRIPSRKENIINCIHTTRNNQTWIGTRVGLCQYMETEDSVYFQHFYFKDSSNRLQVYDIKDDVFNNLWIATSRGLYIFSETDSSLHRIDKDDNTNFRTESFNKLLLVSDSVLWCGTRRGIVRYVNNHKFTSKSEYQFVRYTNLANFSDTQVPLSGNFIYDLTNDNDSNIWVATPRGLSIIPNPNQSLTNVTCYNYLPNEQDPYSIASIFLFNVYKDKSGVIWIGSKNKGISIYNPYQEKFNTERFKVNDYHTGITALQATESNKLWLGTEFSGLFLYDPDLKSSVSINKSFTNKGPVTSICKDKNENILYTINDMVSGGLFHITNINEYYKNKKQSTLKIKKYTKDDFPELENDFRFATHVSIDSFDNIWLTSRYGGLFQFKIDENSDSIRLIRNYTPGYINNSSGQHAKNITYFFRFNKKYAYLSSKNNGIIRLNFETDEFDILPYFNNNTQNSIRSNVVFINRDSKNNLLFGTFGGGLVRYNTITNKAIVYDKGLVSNIITGAFEDKNGD